jgi:hypothetical protein
VDRCKQRELWASTPQGHLLLPTSFLQNSLHITMEARGPAVDAFNIGGGRCRKSRQQPPGGSPSMSPALLVAAAGPVANILNGPAIDVSSFGGGRCRTCRQHPPGGPPSTSSTSVVAAARNPNSNPQGERHQHLQLRWRLLPDLLPALPEGLPSMSSTSGAVDAKNPDSSPQGARHRRLQLPWWLLPDLPPAPPGGPTIDVSSFSDGRCQTCRQHPIGSPPCQRLPKLGTCRQNFSGDTYQGAATVKITTTNKATSRKSEGWSFGKKKSGPCGAKNPGIIIPLQNLSPNQQTVVRHY